MTEICECRYIEGEHIMHNTDTCKKFNPQTDEFITTKDLMKEIAKLYGQLGNKLDELNRLMKKGTKR